MIYVKTKMQWPDVVFLITLASTLLYVVVYNTPQLITSFRFFWAPVTLITIFLFRPTVFAQKFLILLLLYGFISLGILQYTLWSHMSEWNILRLQEEFYWILVFCSILAYYCSKKELHKLAFLSKWSLYFIIITIITTHIALFIDPYVVRSSVNSFIYNPLGIKVSRQYGAAGYGYAQSLVLLIPIFVYFIKTKQKIVFNRNFLIILLFLLIMLLLRANVFANIVVAIPVLILSIIVPKKIVYACLYVVMAVIIAIIIPASFYIQIFIKIGNYFDHGSFMHERILDFALFLKETELDTSTQAGRRAARYPLLFEALTANFFWGDGSYSSIFFIEPGGHLYWMNRLTIWGVFGFSFFVYVLYSVYKRIITFFDENFRYYYQLSVIAFIGLGLVKSIQGREQWLMLILIIPGLYFLKDIEGCSKNTSSPAQAKKC